MFASHDWFDAALAWQPSGTPRFVVLRDRSRLAGAAALSVARESHHRIPLRKLRFLIVPDTQFCDLVVGQGDEDAMVGAFVQWLADTAGEWDVLELDYLPLDGVAARKLPAALTRIGIPSRLEVTERNPLIELDGGWEGFIKAKSRSLKKAINLASNRIAKKGELQISHVAGPAADPQMVDAMLAEAVSVSARSWKRPLGVSLDRPGPHQFATILTRHARAGGWLSLWLLRLDGAAVAMEYQLADQGNVYALRSDYDERFDDVSPGSHLNRELLERLFRGGPGRYYMGPGNNAYKWRWTQDYEAIATLTAYSPSLRGRLARFVDASVLPRMRSIRARRRGNGTQKDDA